MVHAQLYYEIILLYAAVPRDECSSSPCEHICNDTADSFVCSCNGGFVLNSDMRSCSGKQYNYLVLIYTCYWVVLLYIRMYFYITTCVASYIASYFVMLCRH